MRKTINRNTTYLPIEWGVKDNGKIIAYVRYASIENDYSVFGDDADVYEEFEREGFTKTKECSGYPEAYEWLRNNAEDSIRG